MWLHRVLMESTKLWKNFEFVQVFIEKVQQRFLQELLQALESKDSIENSFRDSYIVIFINSGRYSSLINVGVHTKISFLQISCCFYECLQELFQKSFSKGSFQKLIWAFLQVFEQDFFQKCVNRSFQQIRHEFYQRMSLRFFR